MPWHRVLVGDFIASVSLSPHCLVLQSHCPCIACTLIIHMVLGLDKERGKILHGFFKVWGTNMELSTDG